MDLCLSKHPEAKSEMPDTPAIEAWQMMGGEVDWSAIPQVCDLLEVEDPHALYLDLRVMQTHLRHRAGHNG